jgi:deoxyribodipyrimidine photolyase-related protein
VSAFLRELAARQTDPANRRWLFVPYDQLNDAMGPLCREEPGTLLVETPWKGNRRPYHRQKLAMLLANQRHFALEQAERGVAVRLAVGKGPYREVLTRVVKELGPLRVMVPAERELRVDLEPLFERKQLELIPHEGWLTTAEDFAQSQNGPPWRMDAFYRHVRKRTGALMTNGKPLGGKFSFDVENRKGWKGQPPAPALPIFCPDAVTSEVLELIETHFADHPGQLKPDELPSTRADATALWEWAKAQCLPRFGPFEDAMSTRSRSLFHTRISALLNLHRLLPRQILDDVLAMTLPLASQEGFVRQVLGWREYLHHVHVETDGFRTLAPEASTPGDGGFEAWRGKAWKAPRAAFEPGGGAEPSALQAHAPVPPAYWGAPSGLHCLDTVIAELWQSGYGHHITRLMVLANLGTLLGLSPRALTDWFWAAYVDAYDWVVEPNVLAMGTFGTGGIATTKPYVAGAAYIDRMSDYCAGCAFDPQKNCPITRLYWAFLARHEAMLRANPRTGPAVLGLNRRSASERARDQVILAHVLERLQAGAVLSPEQLP